MRRCLYTIVACFLFSSCFGCGSSETAPSSQPVGADVIQKYALLVQGQPATTSITLPQQLAGTEWEAKQDLCQQAGYDLTPYAGQDLALTRYSVTETYHPGTGLDRDSNGIIEVTVLPSLPLYLWVVDKNEATVCGYFSIAEESNYVQQLLESGILRSELLPVNNAQIK